MTPVAAEGLDLPEELAWLVADQPDLLADRIAKLCSDNTRLPVRRQGLPGAHRGELLRPSASTR